MSSTNGAHFEAPPKNREKPDRTTSEPKALEGKAHERDALDLQGSQGKRRKRRRRNIDFHRNKLRDTIQRSLVLRVIQHLGKSGVLRVCAPSDIVAYRTHYPALRHAVVEHYAMAYKYPSHMNAFSKLIVPFWGRFNRPGRQRRFSTRAFVDALFSAAAQCSPNAYETRAMAQMSTGLPTAYSRACVWQKIDNPTDEDRASNRVARFVGKGGREVCYSADPTDDTLHPKSGKSTVETVDATRDAYKSAVSVLGCVRVSSVETMDDFAEHVKFLNVLHSALPDYPVNGYNSTHAQRKQCFARAPDMYAIRMHEWRHGDVKKYLPDVSDNMGLL